MHGRRPDLLIQIQIKLVLCLIDDSVVQLPNMIQLTKPYLTAIIGLKVIAGTDIADRHGKFQSNRRTGNGFATAPARLDHIIITVAGQKRVHRVCGAANPGKVNGLTGREVLVSSIREPDDMAGKLEIDLCNPRGHAKILRQFFGLVQLQCSELLGRFNSVQVRRNDSYHRVL